MVHLSQHTKKGRGALQRSPSRPYLFPAPFAADERPVQTFRRSALATLPRKAPSRFPPDRSFSSMKSFIITNRSVSQAKFHIINSILSLPKSFMEDFDAVTPSLSVCGLRPAAKPA